MKWLSFSEKSPQSIVVMKSKVADYQTKNAEATPEEETHFPNLKKFGEFSKIFSPSVDLNPYYQLVLQVRILLEYKPNPKSQPYILINLT